MQSDNLDRRPEGARARPRSTSRSASTTSTACSGGPDHAGQAVVHDRASPLGPATPASANLYQDANLSARVFGAPAAVWKFAPDLSQPVEPTEDNQAHNIRLTWQAAAEAQDHLLVRLAVEQESEQQRRRSSRGHAGLGSDQAPQAATTAARAATCIRPRGPIRPRTSSSSRPVRTTWYGNDDRLGAVRRWYADRIHIRDTATQLHATTAAA